MIESFANQNTSSASESRLSLGPLEKESKFCIRMQKNFGCELISTLFKIMPGTIKFFVQFEYRPFEPIHDLLKELNENLGELQNEGWDWFYVREKILDKPVKNFKKEWECISCNLNYLDILNHIR